MKVILVDDEPLILAHLEKLIQKITGINIIGTYSNAHDVMKAIEHEQPDVIFLDVEMPEVNGIELAERIQSRWSQVNVVFVTAYSEYAVQAFDLNAVDYLLKPVSFERMVKTFSRLRKEDKDPNYEGTTGEMVCCFHSLQFKSSSQKSTNVRWRTAKAKELFAFLLQHRGKPVLKDIILDLFWPETEIDKGFSHLYTTVYQIRKMLKTVNFNIKITSIDNNYLLDLNGVRLDVEHWEQQVSLLPPLTKETLPLHEEILEMYQGDYLAEDGYLWAESERERLRSVWLTQILKVTDYLVSLGKYTEAIAYYHRVQEIFPFLEENYFMLMQMYAKLGDRNSVETQYNSLKKMCETEFGVEPGDEIQAWYKQWRRRHKYIRTSGSE